MTHLSTNTKHQLYRAFSPMRALSPSRLTQAIVVGFPCLVARLWAL